MDNAIKQTHLDLLNKRFAEEIIKYDAALTRMKKLGENLEFYLNRKAKAHAKVIV